MHSSLRSSQYSTFKDSLARRMLAEPGILGQTDYSHAQEDADSLEDFTSYLSEEIWPTLPQSLRSATHETRDQVPDVDDLPLESTVPPSFIDTLASCGLVSADSDGDHAAVSFLKKALRDYVAEACAPPPMWSKTRTTECEICEREVPLTYHHLIPREVHDKALKKKWHPQAMLNSVAWLCRPCHTAVHHAASNEVLAREFYTVELLLAREDIQKWRKYAAKQRWGVRRG